MQLLALCACTSPILSVQDLVQRYCGPGVVRAADMLGSEISGTDCGECSVIAVLWDVT
jgi:hypothetical protein